MACGRLNARRGGRLRLWWMIAKLLHTLVSIYGQIVCVQQCVYGLVAVVLLLMLLLLLLLMLMVLVYELLVVHVV